MKKYPDSASTKMQDEKLLLKQQRRRAAKPLLWVSMGSIFMAFAGLVSGYIVSRGFLLEKSQWVEFKLPVQFIYSTLIIIISSVVLFIGQSQAKKNIEKAGWYMVVALVLGALFCYFQIAAYQNLISRNIYFTGPGSFTSGSWIYAISFLHLLHIFGGLIALSVASVKATRHSYSEEDHLGYTLASIFWHFLGFVWIFLYTFLTFYR